MKINRRRRKRKTKESYSIAKKNLVSCQLIYFPRGKGHQILHSFSFSLSLYINMYIFIVSKMIFLFKSFLYCFGFSVLLQNAEAGARRCFKKNRCFKYFAKFTEKHLCRCLLLHKDPVWRPVILLKILQRRCSSENFSKFSGTPIF